MRGVWLPNPTEGQRTPCPHPSEWLLLWRALLTWPGPRTPHKPLGRWPCTLPGSLLPPLPTCMRGPCTRPLLFPCSDRWMTRWGRSLETDVAGAGDRHCLGGKCGLWAADLLQSTGLTCNSSCKGCLHLTELTEPPVVLETHLPPKLNGDAPGIHTPALVGASVLESKVVLGPLGDWACSLAQRTFRKWVGDLGWVRGPTGPTREGPGPGLGVIPPRQVSRPRSLSLETAADSEPVPGGPRPAGQRGDSRRGPDSQWKPGQSRRPCFPGGKMWAPSSPNSRPSLARCTQAFSLPVRCDQKLLGGYFSLRR